MAIIIVLACCTKKASAWVIMLNGCSSVGKSTITKKFVKKSKENANIFVVTFDTFVKVMD